MSAPNRAAEAAVIVNDHRNLFGSDFSRRGILYYVCRGLNALDDGNWGVLIKTDQQDFIPTDVICWKPTREHFDILGGAPDRPIWDPKGIPASDKWIWGPADLVKPGNDPPAPPEPPAPPTPPAPPPPPTPYDGLASDPLLRQYVEDWGRVADALETLSRVALTLDARWRDGIKLDVKVSS